MMPKYRFKEHESMKWSFAVFYFYFMAGEKEIFVPDAEAIWRLFQKNVANKK